MTGPRLYPGEGSLPPLKTVGCDRLSLRDNNCQLDAYAIPPPFPPPPGWRRREGGENMMRRSISPGLKAGVSQHSRNNDVHVVMSSYGERGLFIDNFYRRGSGANRCPCHQRETTRMVLRRIKIWRTSLKSLSFLHISLSFQKSVYKRPFTRCNRDDKDFT